MVVTVSKSFKFKCPSSFVAVGLFTNVQVDNVLQIIKDKLHNDDKLLE
jgi:hypothetical protein